MNLLVPLTRLHCQDGIAGHLATILPRLRERGCTATVVVGSYDCPAAARSVLNTIANACVKFAVDPRLDGCGRSRLTTFWRQARSLREWAVNQQVDIIHLHGRALGPVTWLIAPSSGRVYTRHLAICTLDRHHLRVPSLPRYPRIWCDRAIGISLKTCAELRIVDKMPRSMVRHIPNGVDRAYFRPPSDEERKANRALLNISEDTFVCLQLGRVVPVKRPETLARACARLRRAGRNVVAIYAGHCEPEAERSLRQSTPTDNSEWLRILGHQDARQMLWTADVKVLASEREGFPIAVVEAMACGIVPLRTPTDGAEEQIHQGVDGYLFNLDDDLQLSEQIAALIDSPKLQHQMQAAAFEKSKQYEADNMADRVLCVYQELTHETTPSPQNESPI